MKCSLFSAVYQKFDATRLTSRIAYATYKDTGSGRKVHRRHCVIESNSEN